MSKYITKEQEKQLFIALVASQRRQALETIADAMKNKPECKAEYSQLRKKAGAYDLIFWEAYMSLTGRSFGDFNTNLVGDLIEEKLEKILAEGIDYLEDK